MTVKHRDPVKEWFKYAASDFQAAETLFRAKLYQQSIWNCHQALEKHLKGILVAQGKVVRKTHDLLTLRNDTGLAVPEEIQFFLHDVNAYYQPSRYPDAALVSHLAYTRSKTRQLLRLTELTIKWIRFHSKQKK